jgi:hypothetical protein
MRPADIEKLIKDVPIDTSAKTDKAVLGDVLKTLENSKMTESAKAEPNVWRIIMKSRITKLAVAAVIIIAIMVNISYFGGSIDGTTAAWANTLEQIYKATSVTYKKTFEGDKAIPFYFEEMINEDGVIRAVIGGQIEIHALSEGKGLQLIPSRKEATLTHYVGLKHSTRPYNQLDWLISIKDEAGEFIGTEDIDGTIANKFFWQRGEYDNVTVWVDPSTDLPIKVRQVFLPNPDKNIIPPFIKLNLTDFGGADGHASSVGGMGGKGIQKKTILIMKDFIWNQQLDPALFSTEPPEDYTLREKQHDVSDLGENGLIQALAFWTEMSGGSFPEKINDLVDPNQINPMLIGKFDRDDNPSNELDEAMKQASIIAKGLFFAQGKKAEQNWHYAGDGVYLDDSDTMVCWWKQEDTNDYRVIFGDLSVGTVPVGQLPK